MWNVGNIANSKPCFPVRAVNEGSAIAWIFGVFAWPSLYGHVVNVNPSSTGCFPSNFVFSDLDDRMTYTGCRDTWKCSRSTALKVEVSDGDTAACFTQCRVALLVIWVGYEYVPFPVNHVWVKVVWTTRVIDIVP